MSGSVAARQAERYPAAATQACTSHRTEATLHLPLSSSAASPGAPQVAPQAAPQGHWCHVSGKLGQAPWHPCFFFFLAPGPWTCQGISAVRRQSPQEGGQSRKCGYAIMPEQEASSVVPLLLSNWGSCSPRSHTQGFFGFILFCLLPPPPPHTHTRSLTRPELWLGQPARTPEKPPKS